MTEFKVVFNADNREKDRIVEADYFNSDYSPEFTSFKRKNGETVLSLRTAVIQEIERLPESAPGKDEFLSALKPESYVVIRHLTTGTALVVNLDTKFVEATYDANRIDSAHAWAKKMNAEWGK